MNRIKQFQELMGKMCGCGLQDGHPCNTCFHTIVPEELGLSDDMTHLLWLVHLSLREGDDYTDESVFKANKDFFERLVLKVK